MWKRVRDWGSKLRLVPATSSAVTLAVSTLLVAKGAMRLTDKPAAPPPTPTPRAASSGAAQVNPQQLAEGVLTRNIFDSTTGSMPWLDPALIPAVEVDAGAAEGALAPNGRCGEEVRLFASVVNARDPERSLAALRKDGKTHLVPVGGSVGDLTLAALFPTHAYLRRAAGDTCFLPVYVSAHDAPPPAPVAESPATEKEPAAAPVTGVRPALFSEAELQRNIRSLGPQSYAVKRELVLRARANPSGISRGTRFKSRTREGRTMGMEVAKIRDDSLLAHLGLKKGDVLKQLNGFNLGTADGMLEVFGQLSKLDKLSLTIERNGEPQTLRFLLE